MYPSLFGAGDEAARKGQSQSFALLYAHLLLVIGASIAGALSAADHSKALVLATSLMLCLQIVVPWITRMCGCDPLWFSGRAIAESVKTVTWRYIMHVGPFDGPDPQSRQVLVHRLREIRRSTCRSGGRTRLLMYGAQDVDIVPPALDQYRRRGLEELKTLYVSARLKDQRSWYDSKARGNARASQMWFWMTLVIQVAGLVVVVVSLVTHRVSLGVVPPLMTVAAALLARTHAKRYDELAAAYDQAAYELGELAERSGEAITKEALGRLVEQVEDAISREHTMWCARRDVLP